MNKGLIEALFPNIEKNISAKDITTFGVGGKCAFVLRAHTNKMLVDAVTVMRKNNIPYYILGGGSNVIFPDGVLEKVCIIIETKNIKQDKNIVTCDAGVSLETLIDFSINRGLSGQESLAGIPGSIGGAIVGNAGAYGQSISDNLLKIYVYDGKLLRWISKNCAEFSYRNSIFKQKEWIILQAVFEFILDNKNRLINIKEDIINLRAKKYKKGLRCPGSFFKNILVAETSQNTLKKIDESKIISGKIPAGFLLEEVGACGKRQGGIRVASFHGNLLLNENNGTCADVFALSADLKRRVKDKFGIEICEEVRFMA